MENNKKKNKNCGCWAVLRSSVIGGACSSSVSKHSANSIPRTSLVYDAGLFLLVTFSLCYYLFMAVLFGSTCTRQLFYRVPSHLGTR